MLTILEASNHSEPNYKLSVLRKKATLVRRRVVENLDQYLVEFEAAFQKGKGKIHWAVDKMEANKLLSQLISEGNRRYGLKESPVFTELMTGNFLRARREISRVEEFNEDDTLIAGVHFLSCENPTALISKSIAWQHLTKHKGNVVFVATIDQLMPSTGDLFSIAPLLNGCAFGEHLQLLPLLQSSKTHVILVDNGRSELLGLNPQRRLLEFAHPRQFLLGDEEVSNDFERLYYGHLGENKISDIIDDFCLDGYAEKEVYLKTTLEDIVIADRALKAEKTKSETDILWRTWKSAMLSRKILNRSSFGPLSLMRTFFKRGFDGGRSFPKVTKSSFSEQWVKERPDVIQSRKLSEIPKGQLLVRKPATDGIED